MASRDTQRSSKRRKFSDDDYMKMACEESKQSKDPDTKVGAIIVSTKGKVIAKGYNKFPNGISEDGKIYSWKRGGDKVEDKFNNKYLFVLHAEANAILKCNPEDRNGAKIYTTLAPCNECTKLIIESGIKEVVYQYTKGVSDPIFHAADKMLKDENVSIIYRQFEP